MVPLWLSHSRHTGSIGRVEASLRGPLRRTQDGPQEPRPMSVRVGVGMVVSDTALDLSRVLTLILTLLPAGVTPQMPS